MLGEQTFSKAHDFLAIDRILKELPFGNVAFNAPRSINFHNTPVIQLLLSLAATIDELKQKVGAVGEKRVRAFGFLLLWTLGYLAPIFRSLPWWTRPWLRGEEVQGVFGGGRRSHCFPGPPLNNPTRTAL